MPEPASRAGRYVRQLAGYRAFIPAPLPPNPPLRMDDAMIRLLSEADRTLGRLDGVASVLPNPDLFVAMYVRHEAVLSSQIEGTQSTLEDVLEFEAEGKITDQPRDVEEVFNYVEAMNHGLARLSALPLSLRLIREIHGTLLKGVRGHERNPGEFRRTQNWIGPPNCTLAEAEFVPPPPDEMERDLGDLESFLHEPGSLPILVHCGLAHAQFETIHPFLDGNGRMGRLLITFLLCERAILQRPLLYLSYYFKAHRSQYYDRLMAVRNDGDWEGWMRFFLQGVVEVSDAATRTARSILEMRELHRAQLAKSNVATYGVRLLEFLFQRPIVSVRVVEQLLGCSYVTAAKVVGALEQLEILKETTGHSRNRVYRYDPYLTLFDTQALPQPSESDIRRSATTMTEGDAPGG